MLTASGCDAGKATFDEAVDLEEKGEHVAAAEKYDAVCRRAPDSKMCPPSVQRAAALRLRAAEAAMKSKNYAEAEKLARAVDEGQDEPSKRRAAELLVSEEMQTGLRWAKASAATDKRAVLKEVADLAKGDAPVAGDAKAWLTKELPPLLLEDAKAACGPSGGSECRKACDLLIDGYPDAAEAAEAKKLLAAWNAEHPEFGVRLAIPREFYKISEKQKDSGYTEVYQAHGTTARLTITKFYLGGDDASFDVMWERRLKPLPGERITYKQKGNGWFVLSGYIGESAIYYTKVLVSGQRVAQFTMFWDESERLVYDPLIGPMQKSFSLVDLSGQ